MSVSLRHNLARPSSGSPAMSLHVRRLLPWTFRPFGYRGGFLHLPQTLCVSSPVRTSLTSIIRTCPEGFAVRTMAGLCKTRTASHPGYEHFFRYTSGRWLWDEQQQLRDRYRVFDVAELQNSAAKATGSDGCVSMTKLAEGGFNKVFRLLMNDGKAVLARIPNPNAGPPFYTTAAEVATMEFVSWSYRYL
jgi:hypothetical protein